MLEDKLLEETDKIIAEFGLSRDDATIHRAISVAFIRGIDSVDGYLRNSLSAMRASVHHGKWRSVRDELPKPDDEEVIWANCYSGVMVISPINPQWDGSLNDEYYTHWRYLPSPPPKDLPKNNGE